MRTNPPGALVYVDHQLVGPSPASTSFVYYGTRHIEVVGDGYRTEKVLRTLYPKWYQIPPLDFVAESLWPWELRDQRVIDITMVPQPVVPSEELIARGDEMRLQAANGIAVPLTRTQGPPDPPQAQVLPPEPPPYIPRSGPTIPSYPRPLRRRHRSDHLGLQVPSCATSFNQADSPSKASQESVAATGRQRS